MTSLKSIVVLGLLLFQAETFGQSPGGSVASTNGVLLVDGGGTSDPIRARFLELAGGTNARLVVIPTGASGIRFGSEGQKTNLLDPDWPRDRAEWKAYETYLRQYLGSGHVVVLHSRDRKVADSDAFVAPLRNATGVFLWPGNAGRYAQAYLGTRTQTELADVVRRGGVLFGSSAGAIILGSFTVRGRPDKPLLMPEGHTRGFGFLKNVAINPHLTQAKRENELVDVLEAHPELLGIGIDADAALLVRGEVFDVIGPGKVAIYDNLPHGGGWWYWLEPGDRFDLGQRKKL
jgi:cyanophycinase